mmetsp:Transcript_19565/g.57081  ORF Transcript_19565/g.57081 Transcript_19565/m.57081 type:complete len:539 (-) Transcript_19565:608-2224(-)
MGEYGVENDEFLLCASCGGAGFHLSRSNSPASHHVVCPRRRRVRRRSAGDGEGSAGRVADANELVESTAGSGSPWGLVVEVFCGAVDQREFCSCVLQECRAAHEADSVPHDVFHALPEPVCSGLHLVVHNSGYATLLLLLPFIILLVFVVVGGVLIGAEGPPVTPEKVTKRNAVPVRRADEQPPLALAGRGWPPCSGGLFDGGDSPDKAFQKRRGGEAIGAVEPCAGGLSHGPEPREARLPSQVCGDATTRVVGGGNHRHGLLSDVVAPSQAVLVNRGESTLEPLGILVANVQQHVVAALGLHFLVDHAGHHIPRCQFPALRVVAPGEGLLRDRRAQDRALAAEGFGQQEPPLARNVQRCWVELDELQVGDAGSCAESHGKSVAAGRWGIRRVGVHLATPARCQNHTSPGHDWGPVPRCRVVNQGPDATGIQGHPGHSAIRTAIGAHFVLVGVVLRSEWWMSAVLLRRPLEEKVHGYASWLESDSGVAAHGSDHGFHDSLARVVPPMNNPGLAVGTFESEQQGPIRVPVKTHCRAALE